jgi:4-hydroxybenzoate polyprenyltransferase
VRGVPTANAWRSPWRHPWVRHLRLPFNVLLTPIFLWGAWWAGGFVDPLRALVAWVALHVFLYGGTNALNSYYDRDEGPIGGLWAPPPVDRGLLGWAWFVQLIGLPLAIWLGGPFLVAWIALLAIATAYSHPRTRWKAHPWAALTAVALGQGAIGALAGAWATAPRGWRPLADLTAPSAVPFLAAAALLVAGLYVVSQVYQTAEDRRRGDATLPVLLGARRALVVAAASSGLGGALLVALVVGRAGWVWGAAFAAFLTALGVAQLAWAARFDENDLRGGFRATMRFVTVAGLGLSLGLLLVPTGA